MFAALVVMSFVAANAEEPKLSEEGKKELKKLEGKWKAIKAITNGNEETPMKDGEEVVVEFKGPKALVNGKEFFEIASLDPSTDPKCIDLKALMDMGPVAKGTVHEAIYKFDGENLVMAIHIGETKKRPEKFESEKDSKNVVVTLKREK
jgi:uncharacterized protein (TIGR03067 family)